MASRSVIETLMGAVVLTVAAGFVYIAYNSGNVQLASKGYELEALFERIDGLYPGSEVRVGGIKVGSVARQSLDTEGGLYQARVVLSIDDTVKLPKDTSAAVVGDGLLGGKFVSLEPGNDEAMLAPGERIMQTQSSVNIETLIGKMIFGGAEGEEKEKSPSEAASPAPDAGL
ncbi:MAG: superfamily binding cassette transporter substrate binding protein [Rickettsiales bacterium]|jgi:phospholipid/cholesterol/gamma-HCH transport system substrate-binding protein|nr:superfamily binding cassette transporter substrate binding protein [Rickettsiales bacterium]